MGNGKNLCFVFINKTSFWKSEIIAEALLNQCHVKLNSSVVMVFIKLRIFHPPSLSPSKGRDEAVVT